MPHLLLPLLLLAGGGAQQPLSPSAPFTVQDHYVDGRLEVEMLWQGQPGENWGGQGKWRLQVRERSTGRNLWTAEDRGQPTLLRTGQGQGAVVMEALTSGAITSRTTSLYRLRDGQRLTRGFLTVPAIQQGKALLIPLLSPQDAPFLPSQQADPARLPGQVMDVNTDRTLTRTFPIPARPGCGPVQVVESNLNDWEVKGAQLVVRRQDKCGKFQAVFEWTKVPLPRPAFQSASGVHHAGS